jgi:heparosan-N-sulfate-glucuronate 5-epimerase
VYSARSRGPLSFWHETPTLNDAAFGADPRQYWMTFAGKARYRGPFDVRGVPLLDYRGDIGRQYNPIAIAQYGLARFNAWCVSRSPDAERSWRAAAEWLSTHLTPNAHGVPVWMHHFDWPYRVTLRHPWYSGLAQGNGVSMLVRAAAETHDAKFAAAAHDAFGPLLRRIEEGGVLHADSSGDVWIEEYIVPGPTHILNGFIWALWGVRDYAWWADRDDAWRLWHACVRTIERRLSAYDTGWWSLYELAPAGRRRMLASPYYHRLHVTQLQVLARMTGSAVFAGAARRFSRYHANALFRLRAVAEKACFKITRY